MVCEYIDLPGVGHAIVCSRGPRRRPAGKCATCGEKGPALECDKCDAKLCDGCGVSPAKGVDLCPSCFAPAWTWWKANDGRTWCNTSVSTRAVRRFEFRRWVRANVTRFLLLTNFRLPEAA